ncbi:MAG: major capsid protein [Psychrobium sp.]
MAVTDMEIFNDFVMPRLHERLPQEVDKFNAASGGSIILSVDSFTGNYLSQSFYATLDATRRTVNRGAANGAASSTALAQNSAVTVKVAGGIGPVVFEPSQLSFLSKPTQEGIDEVVTMFMEIIMKDQLNRALLAATAAIENNAAATNDVSGGATVTQRAINGGLAKFGDRSQAIIALVMTGAQNHNLLDEAIQNSNSLYTIGGLAVMSGQVAGQGRVIIVTDAPALTAVGKQKVLGLTRGAIVVNNTGDVITNVETSNGKQRIETSVQVDYTFGLGVAGYSWDTALLTAGHTPTDAQLGTGANWGLNVSDVKSTAGVIIVGDE